MEELKKIQEELGAEKLKNAALEAALEEQSVKLTEMEAQLSQKKGSAVSSKREELYPSDWQEKTFKVGKDTFGFLVPQFSFEGTLLTYEAILADTMLQKELVEAGNGCIVKK